MITLAEKAKEKGTYPIEVTVTNPLTGLAVTPITLLWSLSTKDGTIVNSRSAVEGTPGAPAYIVLTAADLAIIVDDPGQRILTVWGDYASTLGTLTYEEQILFSVEDFVIRS